MPEPGTLELDLLLPKPLETVRELPSSPSYASCGRAALEADLREVEVRYSDGDVPLPPHWGGYRVVPDTIEFWQGRESRLRTLVRGSISWPDGAPDHGPYGGRSPT